MSLGDISMNKKIFPLTIIGLIILSLCAIPLTQATAYNLYNYGGTPTTSLADYGNNVGNGRVVDVTGDGHYLTVVTYRVGITSGCHGTIQAVLLNGTSGDQNIIEYSTTSLDLATMPVVAESSYSSYQSVSFSFSGTKLLTNGVHYYIGYRIVTDASAVHNYFYVGGISGAGNYFGYFPTNPGLTYGAGNVISGYMITSDIYGGGAQPTPTASPPPATPTPTPTLDYKWDDNTNQWYFWNGTHWIISSGPAPTANPTIAEFIVDGISIIFPLILLFGLALLGAYFVGSFGFLGGLTTGAILGYIWLDLPLWVLLLVILVDIVALFSGKMGELHIRGRE